jgi:hypothetical protein
MNDKIEDCVKKKRLQIILEFKPLKWKEPEATKERWRNECYVQSLIIDDGDDDDDEDDDDDDNILVAFVEICTKYKQNSFMDLCYNLSFAPSFFIKLLLQLPAKQTYW